MSNEIQNPEIPEWLAVDLGAMAGAMVQENLGDYEQRKAGLHKALDELPSREMVLEGIALAWGEYLKAAAGYLYHLYSIRDVCQDRGISPPRLAGVAVVLPECMAKEEDSK